MECDIGFFVVRISWMPRDLIRHLNLSAIPAIPIAEDCAKGSRVWLGVRRNLRRMRETARSEMSVPSTFSSPRMRATTDWRRRFARSIGAVLRGDLHAVAAAWKAWPRVCGTARAPNEQGCPVTLPPLGPHVADGDPNNRSKLVSSGGRFRFYLNRGYLHS
jgi:hypothetical protein